MKLFLVGLLLVGAVWNNGGVSAATVREETVVVVEKPIVEKLIVEKPIVEKPVVVIRDPAEIPELQPCRYGDETCIARAINIGLKNLYAGVPRLHLLPFDPLPTSKKLRINNEIELKGLVDIDITFFDNEFIGYRNHECVHVRGFKRNPVGEYEIRLKGPRLSMLGTYNLTGNLLRTALEGSGHNNFTVENTDILIRFTGQTREKKGRVHLYTDNLKVELVTSRLYTDLRNLYNGHEVLGRVVNNLFNEHWELILADMGPSIHGAWSTLYQNWLNSLLDTVPYADFFIDEEIVVEPVSTAVETVQEQVEVAVQVPGSIGVNAEDRVAAIQLERSQLL